ncbi:MAG TPA: uracil-DNA glycosylase family protein [Spirochaetota bacterium]|jgi:DNA polymerase|nr:uracil-DNA glycosylase family protein [Spirochaetota bacterium]HON16155.1 uracil-DNA glycosylase family protein [Spirochaetota bacterium]
MKSSDLTNLIEKAFSGNNRVLLFKGEEELIYLKNFLKEPLRALSNEGDNSIRSLIESCSMCKGVIKRKYAFGTGANGVMIILNSPKLVTSQELNIFKKESAELLKKMINAINLQLDECYVTNLVKCESSDSLVKPSDMIPTCLEILKREIEIVKPSIILVLGEIIPLQAVVKSLHGISWFATEHTISLIKNPDLKRDAWNTLKQLKAKYDQIHK